MSNTLSKQPKTAELVLKIPVEIKQWLDNTAKRSDMSIDEYATMIFDGLRKRKILIGDYK